jgi:hypothetical protein
MGLGSSFGITSETNNNIQTNGLIGYWDFAYKSSYPRTGTTWTDLAGSNNGTISGTSFNSTGDLTFDGSSSDSISFGTPSDLVFDADEQFSTSVWIQKEDQDSSQVILQQRRTVIGIGYDGIAGTSTNVPYSYIGATATNASTVLQDDVWYHIATTYNNQAFKLYVNAVVEGSGTRNKESDSGQTVYFGRHGSAGNNFKGKLANLSYYSRELSASEILQNFNAQKQRFGY